MGRRPSYWLLVFAVLGIAISVRSIPMFESTLPTPHAFTYISPTSQAVATGRLVNGGRTDHFYWFTFLAEHSLILGIEPRELLRPLSAVLGALPTILAIAVTRRLGDTWEWPARKTWVACALAGLMIGIQGLYLYRSMAPHPNTIGLYILPLFVLALYRAYRTGRLAWWGATVSMLLIIPPLHVFVSLVIAIIVTLLTGIALLRTRSPRRVMPLVVIAGLMWLYVPGFHYLVQTLSSAHIQYVDRVIEVPGLYVAWILLGLIGTIWFVSTRARHQRVLGWGVFATLFGLLTINAVTPVFHGAPKTPPIMLAGFLPLALLAGLAAWQVPTISNTAPIGPGLIAIVAGTVVIIGITLTSLPTVLHLSTAERANYFLHFPMMVGAGIGGTVLIWRLPSSPTHLLPILVTGGLLVAASAGIPIVVGGVPILPYENSVTQAELSATVFTMQYSDDEWTTDGHFHDLAVRLGPGAADDAFAIVPPEAIPPSTKPTHEWMRSSGTDPPLCLILAKSSWTEGAMFYPRPVERLEESTYEATLSRRSGVFHGGADTALRLTLPRTGASDC